MTLSEVVEWLLLVLAVHPRIRKNVERYGLASLMSNHIRLLPP